MAKVSIIVPIYNKANCIQKCIESIIAQSENGFECILVDDGSRDGSLDLCQSLTHGDERFRIVHKENGGLSSARNAGIEMASAEYITFVDADDFIDQDYLSELLYMAQMSNAELCCTPLQVVHPNEQIEPHAASHVFETINSNEAVISFLYGEKIEISSCGKLYLRELFRGLRFPEGMLYEDVKFSCDVVRKCCKIAVSSTPHYYYLMNDESITHNIDERVFDRFSLALSLRLELDELNDKEISAAAMRYCDYHCLSALRFDSGESDNVKRSIAEAINIISCDRRDLLKDRRVPLIDKCASMLLIFGLTPYRFGWSAVQKIRKYRKS